MMEISKEKKEKKKRIVPIWVCILIFIGAFFCGDDFKGCYQACMEHKVHSYLV